MIFSGSIQGVGGTRQQILSRLLHHLEQEGIEAKRTETGVKARVPGMEASWLPVKLPTDHFDDHLHIEVDPDGQVAYRWIYWTRFQLALHGFILGIFAMDLWIRGGAPQELMPSFLIAQLVPTLLFITSTQLRGRTLFAEL